MSLKLNVGAGPASRRRAAVVRWIVLAAVGVALLLAAGGVYLYVRPTVTVTEVVDGPVVQAFYATGTLQPARNEHAIKSSTAGFVRKADPEQPYIDKGDVVKKDQVLVIVEDSELTHLFDKAKADVQEKRDRADKERSPVLREFTAKIKASEELLQIATRERLRMQNAVETSTASQTDFDLALDREKRYWSELESLRSQRDATQLLLERELAVAESALKIAQWNLDLQKIKSPIDGVVLDRPVSLGTRLAINDKLMTVADAGYKTLVMRAAVDEEDVTKVRKGQTVRVVLYSFPEQSEPFVGKVTRIYEKADPDRRTFEVDVAIESPHERFAIGMTGELAFEVASKPSAPLVPSQAVQDGRVYVIRDGRVHDSGATVGLRGIERAEVASGLKPGDRVLISPVTGLRPGQAVRQKYVEPLTAAQQNKPKSREVGRFGV